MFLILLARSLHFWLDNFNNSLYSGVPLDFYQHMSEDDFIFSFPLYYKTQKELFEFCNEKNILMVLSHPYRTEQGYQPADMRYAHGVEVYKAKLDFVIKMPKNLFSEQKRRVNSSIFSFTKMPHHPDDKVLFYNLEDDGHKSIQHKGRVDDGSWEIKKSALINAINNPEESTDLFKRLKIFDGNSLVINGVRKNDKSEDWVKFSTLFKHVDGSLQSEKNNSDGKYDFITGSDTWKKHDTYAHDEEAIVYIVKSDGSSGKAQYVNGKFTESSLSI